MMQTHKLIRRPPRTQNVLRAFIQCDLNPDKWPILYYRWIVKYGGHLEWVTLDGGEGDVLWDWRASLGEVGNTLDSSFRWNDKGFAGMTHLHMLKSSSL